MTTHNRMLKDVTYSTPLPHEPAVTTTGDTNGVGGLMDNMNHIIEQQKERAGKKAVWASGLTNTKAVTLKEAESLIAQTHQATIAEVVRIIKDELQSAPLEVQMTKGVIFANVISRITINKE